MLNFKVKFHGRLRGESKKKGLTLVKTTIEATDRGSVEGNLKRTYDVVNGLKIHDA